jgi:signal transduction histidine kinase
MGNKRLPWQMFSSFLGVAVPAMLVAGPLLHRSSVDKARSRELGGTGLGLAIVKHIALAHRGAVEVESAVGQGSTFSIRLPASGSAVC